ncbi:MAG: hypothetical protein NZ693_10115 [Thermoflexales bacterium]|nr:hypothetical protein [Thermoflexales bacterium]
MLLLYPHRDILILWERDFSTPAWVVASIALSVSAYTGLFWLVLRNAGRTLERWRKRSVVVLFVLGGLVLQLLVTTATEPDPFAGIARRTFDWMTGGYWTVGAPVEDVRDFVGRYPERAPTYPVHQWRHPPGLSLIFTAGTGLFRLLPESVVQATANWLAPQSCLGLLGVDVPAPVMAAALFGILVEIASAMLVALPLFLWLRRLADERTAAWAVGLYALTPGFSLWVSQFDRGIALFTPLLLYLCERLVTERRLRFALLAGAVFSIATFLTFGAIPLALVALLYSVVRLVQTTMWHEVVTLRGHILAAVGLSALGAASVWSAAWLWSGLDPFRLYQVVFDSHLSIHFPFWPFVFWHPWDLFTMAGLPLVGLTLALGWRRALAPTLAFAATLVALSLAHVARSETGRVWLYFVPLVVGVAAIVFTALPASVKSVALALLIVHTTVQTSVLRVLVDAGVPPESFPAFEIPPNAVQVDTRFTSNGAIALRAYQLQPAAAGEEAQMTLYWERMSDEPIPIAYTAFVHVAKDERDQERIGQHNEMPYRSKYPTTCWQKGQIVADSRWVHISAEASPGEYPVFVGLYDAQTQIRAPAFASPPARELYASILLPTRLRVLSKP